jgi:hypothetical protein
LFIQILGKTTLPTILEESSHEEEEEGRLAAIYIGNELSKQAT